MLQANWDSSFAANILKHGGHVIYERWDPTADREAKKKYVSNVCKPKPQYWSAHLHSLPRDASRVVTVKSYSIAGSVWLESRATSILIYYHESN